MRRLYEASILPKRIVDVSHDDVARVAEEIADWLERTGGLGLEEG